MAKCDFTFNAPEGADQLFEKAKKAIIQNGGELTGDATAGQFKLPTPLGAIKGNYAISAASIQLSITDKPMLLGCGKIEDKLRQYLAPSA